MSFDLSDFDCLADLVAYCRSSLVAAADQVDLQLDEAEVTHAADEVQKEWSATISTIEPTFTPEQPWSKLLAEYPELSRQFYLLARRWIDHRASALEAVRRDETQLRDTFGWELGLIEQLRCVDFSTRATEAVTRIQCHGSAVYYKPRDLRGEQGVGRLIARVSATVGLPSVEATYLPFATYGWMLGMQSKPCSTREEVVRFYQRMGVIGAIVTAIGSQDLHGGNFVAVGEFPILIDGETFIAGSMFPPELADLIPGSINDSYLPGRLEVRRSREENPVSTTRFMGALSHTEAGCRPVLDGKPQPAYQYRDEVIDGYQRTARWIIEGGIEVLRSEIESLDGVPMRLMVRATSDYQRALEKAWTPSALRSWELRRRAIGRRMRPLRSDDADGQKGIFEAHEVGLLCDGIHPHFTIPTGGSRVVELGARVARTSQENAARSLASAKDRWNSDVLYLAAALQAPKPVRIKQPMSTAQDATPTQRLEAWVRGAVECHYATGRYPRWRSASRDPDTNVPYVDTPGLELYSGSTGMGLALLCAWQELGAESELGEQARKLAYGCMDAAAKRSRRLLQGEPTFPIGIDVGGAGVALALMIAGDIADHERWLDVVAPIVRRCLPIPRKHRPDLLGGTAGVVLSLVAAYQRTHDVELLEQVPIAVQQMLGRVRRLRDGGVGVAFGEDHNTGWMHGDAGVLTALCAAQHVGQLSDEGHGVAVQLVTQLSATVPSYPFGLRNGAAGHLVGLASALIADPDGARFAGLREVVQRLATELRGVDCGDDTFGNGAAGLIAALTVADVALARTGADGRAASELTRIHADPLRLGADRNIAPVAYSLFAGTAGPALTWSGTTGANTLALIATGGWIGTRGVGQPDLVGATKPTAG